MAQYVYGKNVVKRLLEDNSKVYEIYMSSDDESIIKLVKKQNIKIIKTDRKRLDKLSQNNNHQGIIAKIDEYKTVDLKEIVNSVPKDEYGLIVVLDEIEDPHNLGAILRSVDCVGAHGVVIKKSNAAPLTPTVAKVSMGAINTVKVSSVTNISMTLKALKEMGYWVVGTDISNAQDYRSLKYDTNIALVIGNEGRGISTLVKKQCDFMVKLPMKGKISSLNASVATGILLYEIYNKRFPLGE
ncbi:MAG: 23S rRNA (guanosine(2251)-2'-O)-methyltransferase RlmB [Erysipelotrichaceae bacterium]|nr:23S rRNA (guanosine(2251)-2'-O)-methyltransferase RlmB [Erysipelotrichaceae bacterium]